MAKPSSAPVNWDLEELVAVKFAAKFAQNCYEAGAMSPPFGDPAEFEESLQNGLDKLDEMIGIADGTLEVIGVLERPNKGLRDIPNVDIGIDEVVPVLAADTEGSAALADAWVADEAGGDRAI